MCSAQPTTDNTFFLLLGQERPWDLRWDPAAHAAFAPKVLQKGGGCAIPHSKRLLLEFFNHETVMACGRFLSQNLKGTTQPLFGQIQSMIIFTDLKAIAL